MDRLLPANPRKDGGDALIFECLAGTDVESVTYADSANPAVVLFNKEGFPGAPFRMPLP